MKLKFEIEKTDVVRIKEFYSHFRYDPFVKRRYKRNVKKKGLDLSHDFIWKALVTCLLTTQQRSGPNSPISNFVNSKPFLFSWKIIENKEKLKEYVISNISNFGGIRFSKKLADEIEFNLEYLKTTRWDLINRMTKDLMYNSDPFKERYYADLIDKELKGFGPKQSRNFIQTIGLSRYEIPIDSRIIKWLNDFGFPLKLSSTGLQDLEYYKFILNAIQDICKKAKIYPCMLDAAIFTSFDKEEWSEDKIIY